LDTKIRENWVGMIEKDAETGKGGDETEKRRVKNQLKTKN
jgi:hypothetical protein